jgi:hypothetical protein
VEQEAQGKAAKTIPAFTRIKGYDKARRVNLYAGALIA